MDRTPNPKQSARSCCSNDYERAERKSCMKSKKLMVCSTRSEPPYQGGCGRQQPEYLGIDCGGDHGNLDRAIRFCNTAEIVSPCYRIIWALAIFLTGAGIVFCRHRAVSLAAPGKAVTGVAATHAWEPSEHDRARAVGACRRRPVQYD